MNETLCIGYAECNQNAVTTCNICGRAFCLAHTMRITTEVPDLDRSEKKLAGEAISWYAVTMNAGVTSYIAVQRCCLDCYAEWFQHQVREQTWSKTYIEKRQQELDFRSQNLRFIELNGKDGLPEYQHIPPQKATFMQKYLNSIRWTHLTHAYGCARDTPLHMLALLSTDEEERESAWDHLYASICHRGSVYEASCAAIPFFIHLLEQVPEDQQLTILSFLADLAHCDWYANREQKSLTIDRDFESPTRNRHQQWSADTLLQVGNKFHEPQWMRLAHRLVGDSIPIYLKYLKTTNQVLLFVVLHLLSGFHELQKVFVPHLEQLAATTTDPLQQAAIIFCLSTVVNHNSLFWQRCVTTTVSDSDQIDPLVRFVSALSLAKYHPASVSLDVINVLVDEMLNPDHLERGTIGKLPWDIHIHTGVCAALSGLGSPSGVQGLITALRRGASQWRFLDTIRVAEALLDTAFFGNWVHGRYWGIATKENDRSQRWANLSKFGESYYNYGQSFTHESQFSLIYPTNGDTFIACSGYDEHEAEQLQHMFEQEGAQALSGLQRQAIEAVINCEQLWQVESDFLGIFGLPIKKEQLEHFLAGHP